MIVTAIAGFLAAAAGTGIEIGLTGLLIPGLFFLAVPLVLGALLLRRTLWGAAVAAVVAAVFFIGALAYPVTAQRLQHPEQIWPFLDAALRTAGFAVAFVGSAIETVGRLRLRTRDS